MVEKTIMWERKKFVRCFVSVWNLMKTEGENVNKKNRRTTKRIKGEKLYVEFNAEEYSTVHLNWFPSAPTVFFKFWLL